MPIQSMDWLPKTVGFLVSMCKVRSSLDRLCFQCRNHVVPFVRAQHPNERSTFDPDMKGMVLGTHLILLQLDALPLE